MSSPSDPSSDLSSRRRLIVFLFLMLSMFMATLDNQIIATALPAIVGDFNAIERFGWVGAAYLLAQSAIMPFFGKLGDLLGRKYVMITAVGLFVLGSCACGLAWSMNSLIAARVLQGVGGGGIMVSVFAINADLFAPRQRAKFQSFASLVLLFSGSVGPALGGVMSETFGWRSIFFINLPVGAVALVGLCVLLPNTRPDRRPKIDYAGAVFLALTISLVVLWADSSQIFGGMFTFASFAVCGAAVLSGIVWVNVERRAAEPIMPLHLFQSPSFPLLLIASLASGGLSIGLINYHAFYLQVATGLSPAKAGLFFMVISVGIVLGALGSGQLIARNGHYKPYLLSSFLLSVVTLLVLATFPLFPPLWLVTVVLLANGIGLGLGQQTPIIGVQLIARHSDVGAATSAVTLCRMAGASLAISIFGALLSSRLAAELMMTGDGASLGQFSSSQLPIASRQAISDAFTWVYFAAGMIGAIGLLAILKLRSPVLPADRS